MYEVFIPFIAFAAFGSFFLALTESIATFVFARWSYCLGPVVLRKTIPGPLESLLVGKSIQTSSGKAKVVGTQKVLFRHKSRLFSIATPFPIKCTMTLGDNPAVIGRIPLGTVCFFGFWLLGWSVGSFFLEQPAMYRAGSFLFGLLFMVFMVGISLPVELRRARQVLQELRQILDRPTI